MWNLLSYLGAKESSKIVGYSNGSQPVVRGPPVVRTHMPGGPRAKATFFIL